MYRIGICDDDLAFCGQLEEALLTYCPKIQMKIELFTFLSGTELLTTVHTDGPFDIIFLDIELSDISGVNIGKILRSDLGNEITQIVYVSSQTSYAMQLFQIRPMDFLIKPVSENDIARIMNTYYRLFIEGAHFFEYKSGKTSHRVDEKHILYFQSEGKTVHIYTTFGTDTFYEKLSDIEKRLNPNVFFNVHKSFVINWNHVAEFHLNYITLNNGAIIPISQSRRNSVQEQILKSSIAKKDA